MAEVAKENEDGRGGIKRKLDDATTRKLTYCGDRGELSFWLSTTFVGCLR